LSTGGIAARAKKLGAQRKTCPHTTLSTTNPIQTGMELNLGQCGDRPANNHLSHGMALYKVSCWCHQTFHVHAAESTLSAECWSSHRHTESCHEFCYNFHVVWSWRQWGGRVIRMAVFGLLSLQILVPRQFARVFHSINMEWVSRKTMWLWLPFTIVENPILKFLTLKTNENFTNVIYWAIKQYEEIWRVVGRA